LAQVAQASHARADFRWLSRYSDWMRTADFQYELPPGLIAQAPALERDRSRLFVVHRASGRFEHRHFRDVLEYLGAGDVLVLNDSRVIPARLWGRKPSHTGRIEVLLVEACARNDWWALLRPGKRVRVGTLLEFHPRGTWLEGGSDSRGGCPASRAAGAVATAVTATVTAKSPEGRYRLQFAGVPDLADALDALGEVPLPPYLDRATAPAPEDRERYQTVYARPAGSVAAPTAGLHFTEALLAALRTRGVQVCFVKMHVGLATFAPVKAEEVADHVMHKERFVLPADTAAVLRQAKGEGRRVIAVGTTSLRVLESAALAGVEGGQGGAGRNSLAAAGGDTRLFVYPPFQFRVVDGLLTNFHLPGSTLLMLVAAFAAPGTDRGRELVLAAYAEAIRERYRFYSYGDAMLLL